jgi:hypothetical protein
MTGQSYFKLKVGGIEEWTDANVAEVFTVATHDFVIP